MNGKDRAELADKLNDEVLRWFPTAHLGSSHLVAALVNVIDDDTSDIPGGTSAKAKWEARRGDKLREARKISDDIMWADLPNRFKIAVDGLVEAWRWANAEELEEVKASIEAILTKLGVERD